MNDRRIEEIKKQTSDEIAKWTRKANDFETNMGKKQKELATVAAALKRTQDELNKEKSRQREVIGTCVPAGSKDYLVMAQELFDKEQRTRELEGKVRLLENNGKIRELEMEIHKLQITLEQKEKIVSTVNNSAFVRHLEGSVKQLKNKLDQQLAALSLKDATIDQLQCELRALSTPPTKTHRKK